MSAFLGPLLRQGSSKDIYSCDHESIIFDCTDWYSVFDVGRASDKIPGKGKAVCASAMTSNKIAQGLGIPTCIIEQVSDTAIRVRKSEIMRQPTRWNDGYVVPLELIYRLEVAGSAERDFQSGKKKPSKYGLPADVIPTFGTPFPFPVHMITTKLENVDREVSVSEACTIGGLTQNDLTQYWSMIDRYTGGFSLAAACFGFKIADGKLEVIMGAARRKSFGDLFGTPDEDRFYKVENGEIIHYGKEYLRQIHIKSGYYAALKKARAEGKPDIPIPAFTPAEIEEASRRYTAVGDTYGRMNRE